MSRRRPATAAAPPVERLSPVFVAALAVVALAFAALQYVRAVEPLGMDQGLFACFGRWVPEGWLPYRDMWDSKPPLILLTYPLAFLVFPETAAGLWWFEGLWLSLTAALAFVVASRPSGRWTGLLAAMFVIAGMWAPGWGGYWARAQAEEFLALWLLGAALAALSARDKPWLAFVAGLLTGIAGLYKVPALLVIAAWPLAWLKRPRFWLKAALLAAGAAAAWGVVLGAFALLGGLGPLIDAVFTYNRAYAAVIAEGMGAGRVLAGLFGQLGSSVPVAAAAGVIGLVALAHRRAPEFLTLAAWIAATLVAVFLQRQLAGYHFLLIVPGLALAAACGVTELARLFRGGRGPARIAGALGLLVLAGLAVWQGRAFANAYGPDLAYLRGEIDRAAYLSRFSGGPFSPAEEEAAAAVVQSATARGDRILVWGLSPGIYFLSQRAPATVYPFHHLLLTESPLSLRYGSLTERRRRFIDDITRDPPALILVGTRDRNGFEPEDSETQLLRFPELRHLVFTRYDAARPAGSFKVYTLKPPGATTVRPAG